MLSPTICRPKIGIKTAIPETSRSVPAPWRPAFGRLDRSAAESQATQNRSADPFTVQPKQVVDYGPPDPTRSQSSFTGDPNTGQGNTNPLNSNLEAGSTNPNRLLFENSNRGNGTTSRLDSTQTGAQVRVADTRITRVTRSFDMLPNSKGQIWREYDISPYTSRITTNDKPQQAIIDWILKETGSEMWFNEPLGILNANKTHLYVYHTPEIHNVIKPIVDRFVNTKGQTQTIDINMVTIDNPNWRSQSYSMLQSIPVTTPGIEAWMISKENAAILLSQLSKRSDFKQHSSGRLNVHDGQALVLEKKKPVQFIRNLRWIEGQPGQFEPLLTQIDEGYKLTISSLSSLDNKTIEATIKCDVDQVEKLETVAVEIPSTVGGPSRQTNLQIPQVVNWRLHERFRWPNDQVLMLSCGVVANPEPESATRAPVLERLLPRNRKRADALLFIEYRGPSLGAQAPAIAGRPERVIPKR